MNDLHNLCIGSSIEKIRLYLAENEEIDLNALDKRGHTALYYAVDLGNREIIDVLIQAGANPHIAGAMTLPPLVRAAEINDRLTIVYFLKHPSTNINASQWSVLKALDVAVHKNYPEIVEELLNHGVNPEFGVDIDEWGDAMTPLETAVTKNHIDCVKTLLKFDLSKETLDRALHFAASMFLKTKNPEKRQKAYSISELIKEKVATWPVLPILPASGTTKEICYQDLFNAEGPKGIPQSKDEAIRIALASMFELLVNPLDCLPYLQFISEELNAHWKQVKGQPFPKFNVAHIDFWFAHEGLSWPIPHDDYTNIKRMNLLGSLLLNKFKQYGMGMTQTKWTGFVPKDISKALLLENPFFTENSRTIYGCFHGNMHNIQRVILLLAIENNAIPLHYSSNGLHTLEPKEIFSALMRNDIIPNRKRHMPLWNQFFDSGVLHAITFRLPQQLYSFLLSNNDSPEVLRDYLRFSFCSKFNQLKSLHNHVYQTDYMNKNFCYEISKLQLETFEGLFHPAIEFVRHQGNLSKVTTRDALKSKTKLAWLISPKHFPELAQPFKKYRRTVFFHQKPAVDIQKSKDFEAKEASVHL